jgi:hypothetical protein
VEKPPRGQPLDFNLSGRRGTARLMSAWEPHAQSERFERDEELRNDGRRRRKGDDVRNRPGGGSTPERAVFEMSVRSRVVMPLMRGHLQLIRCGTQFQQKRRTACRHEADRYVSAKQQDCQQKAGEPISPPGMK